MIAGAFLGSLFALMTIELVLNSALRAEVQNTDAAMMNKCLYFIGLSIKM